MSRYNDSDVFFFFNERGVHGVIGVECTVHKDSKPFLYKKNKFFNIF
jgi:hypothetical protein